LGRENPSYEQRLIKRQAESYREGVTDDPHTGGFILRDGQFLNMGMYGSRGDDHRIVEGVPPRRLLRDQHRTRWQNLVQVCKRAKLIRWMPETWAAEMWTAPTREQTQTLRLLLDARPMTVEAHHGRRRHYREYERWEVSDMVEDLAGFY
jgi:hypothetical protein